MNLGDMTISRTVVWVEQNMLKLVSGLREIWNKQTRETYRQKEVSLKLDVQGSWNSIER